MGTCCSATVGKQLSHTRDWDVQLLGPRVLTITNLFIREKNDMETFLRHPNRDGFWETMLMGTRCSATVGKQLSHTREDAWDIKSHEEDSHMNIDRHGNRVV